MRRFILPTLFFFVCTFSYPVQARAAVPLAIIAASAIGTAMAASATGAYYAKTGQAPQYVSAIAGAAASAADYLFQPCHLAYGPISLVTAASFPNQVSAYLAKNAAIGAKLGDIFNYVKSSATGMYNDLKALIASYTSAGQTSSAPPLNTIMSVPGAELNFKYLGPTSYTQYLSESAIPASVRNGKFVTFPGPFVGTYAKDMWMAYDGTNIYLCRTDQWYGGPRVQLWRCTVQWVGDPATWSPPPGSVDYPSAKSALENLTSGQSDDVRNAIKSMPAIQTVQADAVPATGAGTPPSALTQADISAALAQNTANVAQKALEAAQAVAAANPNDAAAQIAAQQAALEAARAAEVAQNQAAEAEETPPETFASIASNPFAEAYNPGEYDIPTRFNSFLDTVKSSGLFSFSSGFFNSLPGGGSPIITINGGQTFGTHTIDFSQTMTTGLAILKSILLACFGFLSIRAVIMKR